MKICLKLLSFLWLFIYTSANALPISATQSLENLLGHIKSLQADFFETISNQNDGVSHQKLSGLFMLKKPGKFLWETNKPIHQKIISDGLKLWIYDEDLEQVVVKSLKENVGSTPAFLLNGQASHLSEDYTVKLKKVGTHGQIDCYTLIPKKKALYECIQLFFNGKTLVKMRCYDHLGQVTSFYFMHVKTNQLLNDRLFVFTPPKGVDVVNG